MAKKGGKAEKNWSGQWLSSLGQKKEPQKRNATLCVCSKKKSRKNIEKEAGDSHFLCTRRGQKAKQ